MRRIESWSIHGYTLPYETPVTWADVIEAGAPMLLLALRDADGNVGISEVTVKPTWYGASFKSLVGALEEIFLPMLRGMDVSNPSAFYEAARIVPENQVGKAAVDNALWDLHAAASAAPLWRHWGGEDAARVCWLVSRQPQKVMIDEAIDAVERLGIRTLKMKGGQGMAFDCEVMKAVQTAVGPGVQLFVDANWHYTPEESPDYIARLADIGIVAVEDPYRLAPDAAFEAIQRGSRLPLIVDYFIASQRDLALFHARGIKALSLKPARSGLTECRIQAAYAQANGVLAHIGFGGESAVGSFSALQLAASLWCRDSWMPAEVIFFLKMREDLLKEPLVVSQGRVQLPRANSISELLDFARLKRSGSFDLHGRVG